MARRRRFIQPSEAEVLQGFRTLTDGNPFLPERGEAEKTILGRRFRESSAVWHAASADGENPNPNLEALGERAEALASQLRSRLAEGAEASTEELQGYECLVRYLLFDRLNDDFFDLIEGEARGRSSTRPVPAFERCAADAAHFFEIPGVRLPGTVDAAQLFAWGYQIRRAFHHTYRQIFGGSLPAARLRAQVWESIFSCNPDRYRRVLQGRMADVPTLILGESGTGKELVARAIGLSRFIPFDGGTRCFASSCEPCFHPVNLSALPASLIESELFGHRRGAFTGAVEDRTGWLESCEALGSIFLDEIGELDPVIQVKLLRVLQDRSFQRVGETQARRFQGKIIAATHRDLAEEIEAGRFRSDFYYRICADVVRTPSLAEQIADSPGELRNMVVFVARRAVGEDDAEGLADEVVSWVEGHLEHGYGWPGNIRELEQCVRNVMIHGEYHPHRIRDRSAVGGLELGEHLTADEALQLHCTRVYHRVGSYEAAARQLGLDRRTVKARVDEALLERLRAETG